MVFVFLEQPLEGTVNVYVFATASNAICSTTALLPVANRYKYLINNYV